MPDGVCIVGCYFAVDLMDIQKDTSRKIVNGYAGPAGMNKELRGAMELWPPATYWPAWKHADTDGA